MDLGICILHSGEGARYRMTSRGASVSLTDALREALLQDRKEPMSPTIFWLEPEIALAVNYGLNQKELGEIVRILEERKDEIIKRWRKHHGGS